MANGVELASAWVRLIPSLDGAQASITKELSGVDTSKAGDAAGKSYKKGFVGAAALGSAIGNIAANLVSKGTQVIGQLFSDAVTMSDATDKFKSSLSFAGLDTKTIDVVSKKVRKYADETVYDLGTIQNTTAQLASNGVKNYEGLTEAAGNLNAIAGGNADTFKSVAMVLTQTAGAGKLTTENWNQIANAIPGASGILQAALKKNGAYVGNFRDAMAKGEISSEEFNKALMQVGNQPIAVEAAKSTKTMEGAMGNLSATITGKLADAFTAIKPFLTGLISGFSDFISNAQVFLPVVVALAGVLLAALMPAIISLTVATWAWTVALLASPMTWIVIGIGLLIAALVALIMNWDTVVKWLQSVWAGVISWLQGLLNSMLGWWNACWTAMFALFTAIWQGISSFFTGIWNGIVSFFTTIINVMVAYFAAQLQLFMSVWTAIWTGISTFFSGIWNAIVAFFSAIIAGMVAVFKSNLTNISNFWNSIWNGISSFFKGIWNGVVSTVSSVLDRVWYAITSTLNNIKSFWGGIWSGLVDTIGRVFGGIVGAARGPVNGVISMINRAISALNGFHVNIPDWVPLIGGQSWGLSIPHIPMLAKGGTVTDAGWTIVGEHGPELLNLPAGAQVNPNYDDAAAPREVTFNNYAPLGSTPAQELETFANRAEVFLP